MAAKTNWLAVMTLVGLAPAAWGQLEARIDGATLRVTGVTEGGQVALLSVWREQALDGPHSIQTTIEETLVDDDRDGAVEFEAERDIPIPSIWGAVDMENGNSVVIVPEGLPLRAITLGKEAGFGNQVGRLRVARVELQVLVVRPQMGHWRGRARDGVVGDADHLPDRTVTLSLDELEPGESGGQGPALLPGDVVIAIDPLRMSVMNVRL